MPGVRTAIRRACLKICEACLAGHRSTAGGSSRTGWVLRRHRHCRRCRQHRQRHQRHHQSARQPHTPQRRTGCVGDSLCVKCAANNSSSAIERSPRCTPIEHDLDLHLDLRSRCSTTTVNHDTRKVHRSSSRRSCRRRSSGHSCSGQSRRRHTRTRHQACCRNCSRGSVLETVWPGALLVLTWLAPLAGEVAVGTAPRQPVFPACLGPVQSSPVSPPC